MNKYRLHTEPEVCNILVLGHTNKIDCFSGPPTWGKNPRMEIT